MSILDKIISGFSRFYNQFAIDNNSLFFIVTLYNSALLMNYNGLIWKQYYFYVVVFFTIINLFFIKNWFFIFLNICINFWLLLPDFPRSANHSNLIFFINCGIILFVGVQFFYKRKIKNYFFSNTFFLAFLTIVYFYSGFHKLNSDFFSFEVTCVKANLNQFFINIIGYPITISESLIRILQYLIIFIEMVLPFFMFFIWFRKYSALLLLSFHLYLSLVVYADFSAFATFLIFGTLLDYKTNLYSKKLNGVLIFYVFVCITAIIIKNVLFYSYGIQRTQSSFVFGLIYSVGFLFLVFIFFNSYQRVSIIFEKHQVIPIFVLIFLMSFWALKSYIGLGNTGNLTMFSNLITEKSKSNHFIIDTKKTKIFNFEEDAVLILSIDDVFKNKKILQGYKYPISEFSYQVYTYSKENNVPCKATLLYNNDTLIISDLRKSKFNKNVFLYRFIPFRKIPVQQPNKCCW